MSPAAQACMIVGWAWRQPARPSAYGKHHGLRTSSQSGGLAEEDLEHRNAFDAKHTQPTPRAPHSCPIYFSCASTTRKPRVFHRVSGGTGLHDRRMGVATARPSISVRQAPWPANVLAVGRFGGGRLGAPQRLRRQTHPTYAQSAAFMPNLLLMRQHDTETEGVPPRLRRHRLA